MFRFWWEIFRPANNPELERFRSKQCTRRGIFENQTQLFTLKIEYVSPKGQVKFLAKAGHPKVERNARGVQLIQGIPLCCYLSCRLIQRRILPISKKLSFEFTFPALLDSLFLKPRQNLPRHTIKGVPLLPSLNLNPESQNPLPQKQQLPPSTTHHHLQTHNQDATQEQGPPERRCLTIRSQETQDLHLINLKPSCHGPIEEEAGPSTQEYQRRMDLRR